MQAFPAGVVETFGIGGKMFFCEAAGFFDVFFGENFSREVRFDDVLKAGDLRVIEEPSARTDVGIDKARVRRILPPVRQLVAVGIENRI
jgi:hypothetical protein